MVNSAFGGNVEDPRQIISQRVLDLGYIHPEVTLRQLYEMVINDLRIGEDNLKIAALGTLEDLKEAKSPYLDTPNRFPEKGKAFLLAIEPFVTYKGEL